MNIITYEITGKNAEHITTEIMFFVTSAKALGLDIIKLKIKSIESKELDGKRKATTDKILKSVKRKGMIQLYISSSSFESSSTEYVYLINKYPDIKLSLESDEDSSFILKM